MYGESDGRRWSRAATQHEISPDFLRTSHVAAKSYERVICIHFYLPVENSVDVDLNYSFEYRMDEGFIKMKDAGLLKPLKDNYILVENSFIQPLWNLDDLIFDLKLKGYFPILAHPERYNYYHSNKSFYKHLKSLEVLFQVNVLSLSGCYGKDVQDTSMWLLKNDMVEFMATDIHHNNHIIALEQFLVSSQYKKLISLFENLRNDDI